MAAPRPRNDRGPHGTSTGGNAPGNHAHTQVSIGGFHAAYPIVQNAPS